MLRDSGIRQAYRVSLDQCQLSPKATDCALCRNEVLQSLIHEKTLGFLQHLLSLLQVLDPSDFARGLPVALCKRKL